jgi:hypothetical protein
MNDNLLNVVKEIITQYGESVLGEPRRVSAFFADLAQDIPKPQKNAFVKCLEHGFVQILKNAAEPDRSLCKQRLAQKLHEEEGLDLGLCGETIELLAAVLFGEEQQQKKNHCKNCGKELQEEWETCPYCSTPEVKTSQIISSAISSGSGSWGYGVGLINPVTSTSTNNTVNKCFKCIYQSFFDKCLYYGMPIEEAKENNCDPSFYTVNIDTVNLTTGQKVICFFSSVFGLGILFGICLVCRMFVSSFLTWILDILDDFFVLGDAFVDTFIIIAPIIATIVAIIVGIFGFIYALGVGFLPAEYFKKSNLRNKKP